MSELKPCPFCGRQPYESGGYVSCHTELCLANTDYHEPAIGPITDWNTRPIEDALNARIAELEEENDRLQDGWFRDETICPDGSLRPKVSDLLNRIAELEEAQRWIPVSERLPDTGNTLKYYDVILEGEDSVAVALWDGWYKNWSLYEVGDGYVSTTLVTHWRERPTPPEVQE